MPSPNPKPPKPPTPPKKPKHLHGHIVSVSMPLIVRVKKDELSLPVSTTLTVSLNKKPANFEDLLPGDNVFLKLDAGGAVTDIDARRKVPVPDDEIEA